MARKKKSTRRRARARTSVAKRTRRRRKSSGMSGVAGIALSGALYGAGRQYVSDALVPLTARVPLGNWADEAVMLATTWAVWKKKIPIVKKLPMASKVGQAGFIIESARIGAQLANGRMSSTSNTVENGHVYG